MTIEVKATMQYFPVAPLIMVLTFECLDEMRNCNPSNESYRVESSSDAIYIYI